MWSRSRRLAAGLLAAGVALAACGRAPQAVRHPPSPAPAHQRHGGLLIGVYEPYAPGSYWQIPQFAEAVGRWPQIVSYYSGWGSPFASHFAAQAQGNGAETLVQITPRHVSLAAIAAGRWDGYLKRYAAAVRRFHHQVIISFGQEMNGSWYPWGWKYVPPPTFVAAWRHIVRLFRSSGTTNVTWLWDVNHEYPHGMAPLRAYWPGARYVDWVGLDSYLASPGSNYLRHIAPDVRLIRALTRKPILLAETAVGPRTGQVPYLIGNLFAGVRRDHLLGLVWFDQEQHGSTSRQDWRLEGDPAALAAFRKGAAS
jgi:mannan endo-1,4-beta-mannosidase